MKGSLKTGIVAGFLSSLCCTGPLILLLLGLGSFGFASSLPRYRSFFITLAIVFLIFAIYRSIKKKYGTCSLFNLKKELKTIVITIITAVIVWFLLLYIIVPLFRGII